MLGKLLVGMQQPVWIIPWGGRCEAAAPRLGRCWVPLVIWLEVSHGLCTSQTRPA